MVMQNRNVVPRGRARKVESPRDAARTIEFDCTAVANLLDAQTAKPAAPDLDAEIEVVATSAEQAARSRDRFAHTMKRAGAALAVEGSRPLPLPAPPITEEEIEEGTDTEEIVEQSAVTRSMSAVDEIPYELPFEAPPAPTPAVRARGSWLLPISLVLFVGSAVALIYVLV
jgi:hypothetical protein